MELSFQVPWTFPATDHSFICQQNSIWSTYKEEQRNKLKRYDSDRAQPLYTNSRPSFYFSK